MTKEFYIRKRKEVTKMMDENSVAILHSNYNTFKSNDQSYPFKANNNFYYLTGLKEDNIILVLSNVNGVHQEFLFIDENDPVQVKWVGAKYEKEEAAEISGINLENIKYTQEFDTFMQRVIQPMRYSAFTTDKIYLDLEKREQPLYMTFGLRYAYFLKKEFPHVTIKNIYPIVVRNRMIKDPEEINEIMESIHTTRRAIENVWRHHKLLKNESQAVGYHDFVLLCEQKLHSFDNIMASGKNSITLHYEDNNSEIKEGSMMLMDLGSETHGYASDISRTWPVNGKFTKRQREVYQAVLNVNKACIEYATAGMSWNELNAHCRKLLGDELEKLGYKREDLPKYYIHSVSHSMGLDVHDPDINSLGLLEGMVITIEPGLYIPEEGFGVRIEDDIQITKGKAIWLSKEIIKEPEEIEAFIANCDK